MTCPNRLMYFLAGCVLLVTVLIPGVSFAATLEVGSGKAYSTIQSAVNAARSGDTIIAYDGMYQESVAVKADNITIQSKNQWGAVMDGKGGALANAFHVTAGNVKIIGFKIQNYKTSASVIDGVVHLNSGSNGSQVKWCLFENNQTRVGNSGFIRGKTSSLIIRGNIFQNNTLAAGDGGSIDLLYASNCLIELNKFLDISGGYYNYYHHVNGNNSTMRYNYFKRKNRWRMCSGLTIQHNIFEGYLQLHDQNPEDIPNESHEVNRNTFYITNADTSNGLFLVRQDNTDITGNLFLNSSCAINDVWGSSPGTTITNNHYYNVRSFLCSLDASEYTESGTTTGNPSYNSSTGWSSRLASNQGADLKISVWPFTRHDGSALASDYPYSGSNTYVTPDSQTPEQIAPNPPSGLEISSNK